MRVSLGNFLHRAGAVAITLMLCAPVLADPPAEAPAGSVESIWTPKQLNFTFLGFTAHYSCDGLRDRLYAALLRLGARQDLQVREYACAGGLGRPTQFPSVHISMSVLTPVTDKTPADATRVAAHWQPVNLTAAKDVVKEAGDCEIIEQIKQRILPLFTTRNVNYQSTCIPYQLTIGGTQLSAEVLMADRAPGNPATNPPAQPAQ